MINFPEHITLTELHARLTAVVEAVPADIHPVHVVNTLIDLLARVINKNVVPEMVESTTEKIGRDLQRRVDHHQRQAAQDQDNLFDWPATRGQMQ